MMTEKGITRRKAHESNRCRDILNGKYGLGSEILLIDPEGILNLHSGLTLVIKGQTTTAKEGSSITLDTRN